jgi:hypothetical protein
VSPDVKRVFLQYLDSLPHPPLLHCISRSYRISTFNHPLFRSFHSDDTELDYTPPDAYNAPGNLIFDPSKPLEADWVPLDQSLPSPINWLRVVKAAVSGDSAEALPITKKASHDSDLPSKVFAAEGERQASHVFRWNLKGHGAKSRHGHHHHKSPIAARPLSPQILLEPFKKTTILIIGDSVDRNGLKFMAENLGANINIAQWDKAYDTEHWKHLDNGVDPAYLPHQLTLPHPVDALITNCFLFGFVGGFPDAFPFRLRLTICELCRMTREPCSLLISQIRKLVSHAFKTKHRDQYLLFHCL